MSKPNFQAMSQKELHTYVLAHQDDREAFSAYMDKLHTEAKWIEMPPLQSPEDLENYPEFLEAIQKSLYETDFVRWVETTLKQLRAQDYTNVDWANLLLEIEDMSKRERKSLKSNLVVILLHLLKWQYRPECRSGSWRGSIREHRRRINDDLKDSPSLKPYMQEVFAECYANAREQAADETNLSLANFPLDSPYTEEQVLDSHFLPK